MIVLGSLFSALATLNSGGLFPLAMKLLDLPAYRCLIADCRGGSCRKIVGDDPSVSPVEETNLNTLALWPLGISCVNNDLYT